MSASSARWSSRTRGAIIPSGEPGCSGLRLRERYVLQLVRTRAAEDSGVVMITHDVQSVLDVSDRVVVLSRGMEIFDGATSALTDRELVQLMAGLRLG